MEPFLIARTVFGFAVKATFLDSLYHQKSIKEIIGFGGVLS